MGRTANTKTVIMVPTAQSQKISSVTRAGYRRQSSVTLGSRIDRKRADSSIAGNTDTRATVYYRQ